jgi:hypothetical protein
MTAESDLLANLTNPHSPYPWEPLSPEAEAYFTAAVAELDDPLVESSIAAGWQNFSAQLMAQWDDLATTSAVAQRLAAEFQERIPLNLLQAIATTATSVARNSQSFLEQMVVCANVVLPTWTGDDLAVLARPLAYSLRDGQGEILDLTLRATAQTDWETLSEVEKARLSLAISSVALKAAQNS